MLVADLLSLAERWERERTEYGYPWMPRHSRPTSDEIAAVAIAKLNRDFASLRAIHHRRENGE